MNFPSWILERAFGGTHIADTPGTKQEIGPWPIGEAAPPAQLVCDLLSKTIDCSLQETYCFLIGGAGNGKSFLARDFSENYTDHRISAVSKFAERNYDYLVGGDQFLRIVNDATIPPSDENALSVAGDYLVSDINTVFSKSGYLLACVNRGILITERRSLDQSGNFEGPASTIINWLLNEKVRSKKDQDDVDFEIVDGTAESASYYGFCQIKHSSGKTINIHAAFMDQTSLFEPPPLLDKNQNLAPSEPIKTDAIKLAILGKKQRGESGSPATSALTQLYHRVSSEVSLEPETSGSSDPIAANLQCLNNSVFVTSICSVIRGAEILSASHITYRDLWGISVLALLGAVPANGYEGVATEIASLRDDFQSSDLNIRLCALVQLATRRTHMALFSSAIPGFVANYVKCGPSLYPSVGAVSSLSLADPLLSLTDDARDSIGAKLALIEERSPVGHQLASLDESFSKVWTPFDVELESTILRWLDMDPSPLISERNELLSWYGRYLYRLFSVSRGYPADVHNLGMWQTAWNHCATGHINLPKDIKDGLNSLVFSSRNNLNSACLLPLLSSHVEPAGKYSDRDQVTLGILPTLYRWQMSAEGDSLMIKLSHIASSEASAEIQLDYPILREALESPPVC